jgi:hypothetical protein
MRDEDFVAGVALMSQPCNLNQLEMLDVGRFHGQLEIKPAGFSLIENPSKRAPGERDLKEIEV